MIGIGLGANATIDAAQEGNTGLAIYRGLWTALGAFSMKYWKTARGDLEQPASLSNAQARDWYHAELASIPQRVDQTGSWRIKGLQAFFIRYLAKIRGRELMKDRAEAAKMPPPQTLSETVAKYYRQGYTGDRLWQKVYEKSMESNAGVDSRVSPRQSRGLTLGLQRWHTSIDSAS